MRRKHKIASDKFDSLAELHLLKEFDVHCSESGVAGNEALVRLAPVPRFFYRYPTDAVEFSGISGAITHGDPKAYDSCRYYGALVVAVLRGETKRQLLDDNFYLNHKSWFNKKPLTPDVMKVAQGSYKKPGGYHDDIRDKEYIVDALAAALWAFYYDENSFEKGILDAVNLGDDSDAAAAIYGPLAGAYYGFDNLPKKWISQVDARHFITCVSKWIIYEGELWQPKPSISSRPEPNPQSDSFQIYEYTEFNDCRQTRVYTSIGTDT
jgi:ADP-ribosylglycohydrolase